MQGYSNDATLRSIEDSLARLRTDHIEIVFVHDLTRAFWGDEWVCRFEQARTGAFRAHDRLRDEGVIKAWGLGVNLCEQIETLLDLEEPRPNAFLLAGRYTLLEHSRALQRLMPALIERDIGVVIRGPSSSGALVGDPKLRTCAVAARDLRSRRPDRGHSRSVRGDHEGGRAAILAGPSAVAAAIPGASRPGRIAEDRAALNEAVPAAFWQALRDEELVDSDAPLPM